MVVVDSFDKLIDPAIGFLDEIGYFNFQDSETLCLLYPQL